MEQQIKENTASIARLEVMQENVLCTVKENSKTVQMFIDKFYEKDKPVIDASKRFMRGFWKVFWIVTTPLIAGLGIGIIVAGSHFLKGN